MPSPVAPRWPCDGAPGSGGLRRSMTSPSGSRCGDSSGAHRTTWWRLADRSSGQPLTTTSPSGDCRQCERGDTPADSRSRSGAARTVEIDDYSPRSRLSRGRQGATTRDPRLLSVPSATFAWPVPRRWFRRCRRPPASSHRWPRSGVTCCAICPMIGSTPWARFARHRRRISQSRCRPDVSPVGLFGTDQEIASCWEPHSPRAGSLSRSTLAMSRNVFGPLRRRALPRPVPRRCPYGRFVREGWTQFRWTPLAAAGRPALGPLGFITHRTASTTMRVNLIRILT